MASSAPQNGEGGEGGGVDGVGEQGTKAKETLVDEEELDAEIRKLQASIEDQEKKLEMAKERRFSFDPRQKMRKELQNKLNSVQSKFDDEEAHIQEDAEKVAQLEDEIRSLERKHDAMRQAALDAEVDELIDTLALKDMELKNEEKRLGEIDEALLLTVAQIDAMNEIKADMRNQKAEEHQWRNTSMDALQDLVKNIKSGEKRLEELAEDVKNQEINLAEKEKQAENIAHDVKSVKADELKAMKDNIEKDQSFFKSLEKQIDEQRQELKKKERDIEKLSLESDELKLAEQLLSHGATKASDDGHGETNEIKATETLIPVGEWEKLAEAERSGTSSAEKQKRSGKDLEEKKEGGGVENVDEASNIKTLESQLKKAIKQSKKPLSSLPGLSRNDKEIASARTLDSWKKMQKEHQEALQLRFERHAMEKAAFYVVEEMAAQVVEEMITDIFAEFKSNRVRSERIVRNIICVVAFREGQKRRREDYQHEDSANAKEIVNVLSDNFRRLSKERDERNMETNKLRYQHRCNNEKVSVIKGGWHSQLEQTWKEKYEWHRVNGKMEWIPKWHVEEQRRRNKETGLFAKLFGKRDKKKSPLLLSQQQRMEGYDISKKDEESNSNEPSSLPSSATSCIKISLCAIPSIQHIGSIAHPTDMRKNVAYIKTLIRREIQLAEAMIRMRMKLLVDSSGDNTGTSKSPFLRFHPYTTDNAGGRRRGQIKDKAERVNNSKQKDQQAAEQSLMILLSQHFQQPTLSSSSSSSPSSSSPFVSSLALYTSKPAPYPANNAVCRKAYKRMLTRYRVAVGSTQGDIKVFICDVVRSTPPGEGEGDAKDDGVNTTDNKGNREEGEEGGMQRGKSRGGIERKDGQKMRDGIEGDGKQHPPDRDLEHKEQKQGVKKDKGNRDGFASEESWGRWRLAWEKKAFDKHDKGTYVQLDFNQTGEGLELLAIHDRPGGEKILEVWSLRLHRYTAKEAWKAPCDDSWFGDTSPGKRRNKGAERQRKRTGALPNVMPMKCLLRLFPAHLAKSNDSQSEETLPISSAPMFATWYPSSSASSSEFNNSLSLLGNRGGSADDGSKGLVVTTEDGRVQLLFFRVGRSIRSNIRIGSGERKLPVGNFAPKKLLTNSSRNGTFDLHISHSVEAAGPQDSFPPQYKKVFDPRNPSRLRRRFFDTKLGKKAPMYFEAVLAEDATGEIHAPSEGKAQQSAVKPLFIGIWEDGTLVVWNKRKKNKNKKKKRRKRNKNTRVGAGKATAKQNDGYERKGRFELGHRRRHNQDTAMQSQAQAVAAAANNIQAEEAAGGSVEEEKEEGAEDFVSEDAWKLHEATFFRLSFDDVSAATLECVSKLQHYRIETSVESVHAEVISIPRLRHREDTAIRGREEKDGRTRAAAAAARKSRGMRKTETAAHWISHRSLGPILLGDHRSIKMHKRLLRLQFAIRSSDNEGGNGESNQDSYRVSKHQHLHEIRANQEQMFGTAIMRRGAMTAITFPVDLPLKRKGLKERRVREGTQKISYLPVKEAILASDVMRLRWWFYEQGVDPDFSLPDDDPLIIYAVKSGRPQIVSTILEAKAAVNTLSRKSLSPLHAAVSAAFSPRAGTSSASDLKDILGVVSLLLRYGANPLLRTRKGKSPLDLVADARTKLKTELTPPKYQPSERPNVPRAGRLPGGGGNQLYVVSEDRKSNGKKGKQNMLKMIKLAGELERVLFSAIVRLDVQRLLLQDKATLGISSFSLRIEARKVIVCSSKRKPSPLDINSSTTTIMKVSLPQYFGMLENSLSSEPLQIEQKQEKEEGQEGGVSIHDFRISGGGGVTLGISKHIAGNLNMISRGNIEIALHQRKRRGYGRRGVDELIGSSKTSIFDLCMCRDLGSTRWEKRLVLFPKSACSDGNSMNDDDGMLKEPTSNAALGAASAAAAADSEKDDGRVTMVLSVEVRRDRGSLHDDGEDMDNLDHDKEQSIIQQPQNERRRNENDLYALYRDESIVAEDGNGDKQGRSIGRYVTFVYGPKNIMRACFEGNYRSLPSKRESLPPLNGNAARSKGVDIVTKAITMKNRRRIMLQCCRVHASTSSSFTSEVEGGGDSATKQRLMAKATRWSFRIISLRASRFYSSKIKASRKHSNDDEDDVEVSLAVGEFALDFELHESAFGRDTNNVPSPGPPPPPLATLTTTESWLGEEELLVVVHHKSWCTKAMMMMTTKMGKRSSTPEGKRNEEKESSANRAGCHSTDYVNKSSNSLFSKVYSESEFFVSIFSTSSTGGRQSVLLVADLPEMNRGIVKSTDQIIVSKDLSTLIIFLSGSKGDGRAPSHRRILIKPLKFCGVGQVASDTDR